MRRWDSRTRPTVQLSLVRFYSTPPISKDELLARIRADATVSEPVRKRALQFAQEWRKEYTQRPEDAKPQRYE